MPRLVFIGSVCADIVVRIPHLPKTGEDVHITSQQVNLGGCAFNAFYTARSLGMTDCELYAPVGTGPWGEWVRAALSARQIATCVPYTEEENGCCYCLVDANGERSFLCEHGAEYRFRREWLRHAALEQADGVYLCGLQIEEQTGGEILAALEADRPGRLYFAPGPRISRIKPQRMARIMAMSPVLHLNEEEALSFTHCGTVEEAAALLHHITHNDVIVTMGSRGAYALSAVWAGMTAAKPADVVDTIGAGDAHLGALMAYHATGLPLQEAVQRANRIAALVVSGCGTDGLRERERD